MGPHEGHPWFWQWAQHLLDLFGTSTPKYIHLLTLTGCALNLRSSLVELSIVKWSLRILARGMKEAPKLLTKPDIHSPGMGKLRGLVAQRALHGCPRLLKALRSATKALVPARSARERRIRRFANHARILSLDHNVRVRCVRFKNVT